MLKEIPKEVPEDVEGEQAGEISESETTLDDLQNGYFIRQYRKGFRFGMDAVLLADFAEIKRKENVLDLGSGTGIIPLLLAARTESRAIRGIELFRKNVLLARENIALNSLEDRIEIQCGDIKNIRDLYGEASFDAVVTNPPYMPAGHGARAPEREVAAARHEICCTIRDIAAAAAYVLKSSGKIYMVHRPSRLSDIFRAFSEKKLEIKILRFIHPHSGSEPNMVLVRAVKGASPGIRVLPPLYIYDEKGHYTEETLRIYSGKQGDPRDGQH